MEPPGSDANPPAHFVAPPGVWSFSIVMTVAPLSRASSVAAKPPPPVPTTTMSASALHSAGGSTGAMGAASPRSEPSVAPAVESEPPALGAHAASADPPSTVALSRAQP